MKTFFILLFILNTLFSGFTIDKKQQLKDKIINSVFEKAAASINVKYNIRPVGTGFSSNEGKTSKLTLCFYSDQNLSKNDLRNLLIETSNILMSQINNTEGIQQLLSNHPFTQENIGIVIYNFDKEWDPIFDPYISVAEISGLKINYLTNDPNNKLRYKNSFDETYEEALEALKSKN